MKVQAVSAIARDRQQSRDPAKNYLNAQAEPAVTWPDQVWAMDITSIPMVRGFVYLAAVVDRYSRRVLTRGVSFTMETAFCWTLSMGRCNAEARRRSSTPTRAASSAA